jgi:hypothetical protein
VDAHRLSNGQWLASVDGCGHPPFSASKSSLNPLSDGATRMSTQSFTNFAASPSMIANDAAPTLATDDDGIAIPSRQVTTPTTTSYSISSGHMSLAVRNDGLVVVIAVTEPQFFALTYLLDALRLAHAQVIVYDMGI